MGIPLQTASFYDLSGGVDLKSSPTKVAEDDASSCLNVDYSTDGAVFTRNGSSIMNQTAGIPQQISGAPNILYVANYNKSDGTNFQFIATHNTIYQNLVTPTASKTGLNSTNIPDMAFTVTADDEYEIYGNGQDDNLKFNGTSWTNLSLPTPTILTLADGGGGALPVGDYNYYVAFARIVSGAIVQLGDLSPVASINIAASHQVDISNIAISADSQVNARVLYRQSPTSGDDTFQLHIINDNVTTTYTDDTADDGSIPAEFDNQPAPKSNIFEEAFGCMNYVDFGNSTDVYEAKNGKPWNSPDTLFEIFDGPVRCLVMCYGVLITGTDRSLWVRSGTLASGAVSKRISSIIGIMNNRCAVGQAPLYIFSTNRKFYTISPTDFFQTEIRINNALSLKIEPLFAEIGASSNDQVCMEYYTAPNVSKVILSCPVSVPENNNLIIFNETQSTKKGKPVWEIWDNINANALRQITISGVINLYSGDYNGFLWKLDDDTTNGDGAEENGTVSSATGTTVTDTTKTFTVNALTGCPFRVLSGPGVGETSTVVSNTAHTITLADTFSVNPTVASTYTVGGYNNYHYTNWKMVLNSYDALKQLWYIIINANASGDYPITMILQFDFDTTISNQTNITLSLASGNAIWGSVIWWSFIWGAFEVFQNRFRQSDRFYAMRVGFFNNQAGQPFQINGFSITAQDKNLYYKAN